jgi:hypothetical protein
MSANRTVTQRRSSGSAEFWTGLRAGVGGADGAGVAAAVSEAPHSMQNFWPAEYGVEQFGQRNSSRVPHSMQNFASGGFCAPQRLQVVTVQL